MGILLIVIGLVLILITILDIFETLFDPEGQGRITDAICWTVWKLLKTGPGSLLAYAGPAAYVSVIAIWASLLLTGWAFIYWSQLPDAFVFDEGFDQEDVTGIITAYYISITTISTLGYGDITPTPNWLRIVGPIQSLLGFLLLTAAISWILAIYQDIEKRRSLAH
jgi:voltage-gated potassium channel Kch